MTTDAKQIEPALSAGEWRNAHEQHEGLSLEQPDDDSDVTARLLPGYPQRVLGVTVSSDIEIGAGLAPVFMALANAALPDDSPYKITRKDLEAILLGVEGIRCCGSEYDYREEHLAETRAEVAALQIVHAKLEALLPPEG